MAIAVVLICAQVLLIALIFPVKLSCTTHFSLASEAVNAQFKFAGISIARIKVCVREGLKVQINGKTLKNLDNGISVTQMGKIARFLLENEIVDVNGLIAYVGANDAKNGAILCAIVQMLPIFAKTVIQDESKDRFDAECGIRIRINAVQAIKAIAIGKGR